ncbi:MAG: hypothetical protein MUC62_04300 [Candidatus Thermoplasmatota archaeon]|jgi:hypothetical protein|nr:hypothetical protein [Candidatus Thermoplasmatota archaeon]
MGVFIVFTFEGFGECDPNSPDSDDIPDGYEILYGIKEPFLDSDGNLIIDPTTEDPDNDLDPNGRDIVTGILPDENNYFETVTCFIMHF